MSEEGSDVEKKEVELPMPEYKVRFTDMQDDHVIKVIRSK